MKTVLWLALITLISPIGVGSPCFAGSFTASDVEAVISRFGPIMKLHPSEEYLMDDPEAFLKSEPFFLRQSKVRKIDYRLTWVENLIPFLPALYMLDSLFIHKDLPHIHSGTLQIMDETKSYSINSDNLSILSKNCKDLFPNCNVDGYETYIDFDEKLIKGNQSRASRLIAVREQGSYLYVTFWFFYPFNGAGRAKVGPLASDSTNSETGRHWGDWEHVTLKVEKTDRNGNFQLDGIFLSRHDFTPWYQLTPSQSDRPSPFAFETRRVNGVWEQHPIIYVALHSHGHYPQAGDYVYGYKDALEGSLRIRAYDTNADGGEEFDTSLPNNRRIISSNVVGMNAERNDWFEFYGRWGKSIDNIAYVPDSLIKDILGLSGRLISPAVSYLLPKINAIIPINVPVEGESELAPSGPKQHRIIDEIKFASGKDKVAFNPNYKDPFIQIFALAEDGNGDCCELLANENLNSAPDDMIKYSGEKWTDWKPWSEWREGFKSAPLFTSIVAVSSQGLDDPSASDNLFAVGRVKNASASAGGPIYHNWKTNGEWQPDWKYPNIPPSGNVRFVAASAQAPHARALPPYDKAINFQLEVFAVRASDGSLIHTSFDGANWDKWSADFQGAPRNMSSITIARTHDKLVVFGIDSEGKVISMSFSANRWSTWTRSPNSPTVTSISAAGNPVEILAVGADHKLYTGVYDDDLTWATRNTGLAFDSDITGATLVQGANLEAFLIQRDGRLQHNWKVTIPQWLQDPKVHFLDVKSAPSEWHGWQSNDQTRPAVAIENIFGVPIRANQETYLFANTKGDGQIADIRLVGSTWQPWNYMIYDGTNGLLPLPR